MEKSTWCNSFPAKISTCSNNPPLCITGKHPDIIIGKRTKNIISIDDIIARHFPITGIGATGRRANI
jgi:hypothetical protein